MSIQLLLSGSSAPDPEPTGDVIFLYDPATNKDLVTGNVVGVLRASTTVDSAVKIDGNNTVKFSAIGGGVIITPTTPINFESMPGWTIEWSSLPVTMGTSYVNELFFDLATASAAPMGCRWTDGGFQQRLQFNFSNFANNNLWRPPFVKNDVLNVVNHYAITYTAGKIRIFRNGAKQTVMSGTAPGPGTDDFITKIAPFLTAAKIYMGWFNGSNPAFIGNMGRLRISDFCRYVNNYAPAPF